MSELFKHEQLAKWPSDKPIVVLCKSGTRATAVATALCDVVRPAGRTYLEVKVLYTPGKGKC